MVNEARGELNFSHEAHEWPLPYQEFPSDNTFDVTKGTPGPDWLREKIGDDYFRSLVSIGLADRQAGSMTLVKAISQLRDLWWLDLARNRITDEMIPSLTSLKQLRVLILDRNPELTDDGLARLTSLSNLEVLSVNLVPRITGAFLKDARQMSRLRELDVQFTPFEGANLRFLAGHPEIHRLTMRKTKISDDDMQHLTTIPQLRLLDIGDTAVTASGIARLSQVPLVHLYIEGNHVTDSWLPHLSEMKTLNYLAIWNSQMSEGAVNNLKLALPDCNVDFRNDD